MFERSVAHRSWTVTVALRALRSTETTFMSWRNCGFEVLRLETDWSDWSKFAGTYSKKFKDDPNRPSSPSWKNISNCTVEICAPPAHRHGGSGAKTYPVWPVSNSPCLEKSCSAVHTLLSAPFFKNCLLKKKEFGTHVLFRFLLYNKIGQKSLILN